MHAPTRLGVVSVLAVAVLAAASPALGAVQSVVSTGCTVADADSFESGETGVRVFHDNAAGAADAARQELEAFAFAAEAQDLDDDCGATARFGNRLTVVPGRSGLAPGEPVLLELRIALRGRMAVGHGCIGAGIPSACLEPEEEDFVSRAEMRAEYDLRDLTQCGFEACTTVAHFDADVELERIGLTGWFGDPDGSVSETRERSWSLSSNASEEELGVSDFSEGLLCDAWAGSCVVGAEAPGDPGFRFVLSDKRISFEAKVGSVIAIDSFLNAFATAHGDKAHARSDFLGTFRAEIVPAPGFEDLGLMYESAKGLAVTKRDRPDPVRLGNDVTYTMDVTNYGPEPVTGVTLADTLPVGVEFVSASSTHGRCPSRAAPEGVLTCDLGTMPKWEIARITVVVRPSAVGIRTNRASVSANEPEPDPSDNTATATTHVRTLADLSLTKTATPSSVDVVPSSLHFSLSVRNEGPDEANRITVQDTLPGGARLVSATPSRGTCSGTAVVTCDVGTLASGEGATVELVATVRVGKEIPNTATVSSPDIEDPNPANDAARTVTPCPPCAQLAVDKIEVTQGIQFLGDPSISDNSVPLIQDKATLVRVYFKDPLVPGVGFTKITGELSTFTCGGTTPISPPLPNGQSGPAAVRPVNAPRYPDDPNLDDANNLNRSMPDQRSDLNRTLNFVLPHTRTRPCTDLVVTISSPDAPAAAKQKVNALKFETVPAFKLRLYSLVIPLTNAEPRAIDRALLALWLTRAYPISKLIFEEGHFWRPFGQLCAVIDFDLTTHKWMNIAGGEDFRFKYYAMQNDDAGFLRGCTIGGPVGSGPTGVPGGPNVNGAYGWDADGSYGDWYGAHELGHTHGRAHVNATGAEPGPDPSYPYPTPGIPGGPISTTSGGCTSGPPAICGSLWGVDLRLAGLTEPGGSGSNPPVIPPTWVDVMSYGNRQWISDYTYKAIKDHIQEEGTAPADSTLIVRSGPAGPGPRGEYLAVMGLVHLTDGTVELDTLYRLPDQVPILGRTPGPYTVRLLDADGATVADYPFTPRPVEEQRGGPEDELAAITELVPYDARTARIAVRRGGETLAERAVSPHAPVVTMRAPAGGGTLEGDSVGVQWDVSDADGDGLTPFVSYSADGGDTWSPVAGRVPGTHVDLDISRLRGTTQGLFRVLVSDGVNTGRATTTTPFTVPEKPPEVVLSRSTPISVAPGEILGLSGVGLDPEDGLLDEGALGWRSDLDGVLGTGSVLMTAFLSEGTHRLTLTGSDSDGNEASASLTAVVSGNEPPTTTAAVSPAANAYGWHRVDVSVMLAAEDDTAGVTTTEYNLDDAGWVTYTGPIALSAEGVHTLLYRSMDAAGNVEAARTLTVRIDKTAPEAELIFSRAARDLRVCGTDALAGLGSACPAPTLTARALGDDHDEGRRLVWTLEDLAGNRLALTVRRERDNEELKSLITELTYATGPGVRAVTPIANLQSFEWDEDELEQMMSLGSGRSRLTVHANYEDGRTTIIRREGKGTPTRGVRSGFVLLRLITRAGTLSIAA